ncbi:MAG: beta-ketoacyl-[acyl-carrier-protein] synthase family protein [Candidatus Aminicenantes bacterium]|nr:beta-ketoacyl-[acyl-carrier-protein] synthase family protein [Candidatus Aminicenantes bacterium]
MRPNRVVVTGLGCLCAAGAGLESAWKTMMAGRARPAPPTKFRAEPKRPSPVFEIPGGIFRRSKISPPRPVDKMPCLEYLLSALEEALEQAGLSPEELSGRRVGVSIGTTVGCTLNDEGFYAGFRKGLEPGLDPVERFLACNPAPFLSEALGLRGPVCTINNACSSGTDAVGQAREWILDGLCDLVIAGGTDELSRVTYLGFSSLLNTSERACLPFDARRDGLNLGEGAGVLIVESRRSAAERRAEVLAEVEGYGSSLDAYHVTAPHPEGSGLESALRRALGDRNPAEVGFVNAHGTATDSNDKVEGRTLARVFGPGITVVGTKPYTGHTLGAAGALEAVFTVQGLLTGCLPATLGFSEPDPECVVVPTRAATSVARTLAVSTSLAFGGHNAALLIAGPGP